jgi:hypothetical protein
LIISLFLPLAVPEYLLVPYGKRYNTYEFNSLLQIAAVSTTLPISLIISLFLPLVVPEYLLVPYGKRCNTYEFNSLPQIATVISTALKSGGKLTVRLGLRN